MWLIRYDHINNDHTEYMSVVSGLRLFQKGMNLTSKATDRRVVSIVCLIVPDHGEESLVGSIELFLLCYICFRCTYYGLRKVVYMESTDIP